MEDNINPQHYRNGEIECITALEAATVNKKGSEAICVSNVIKYLWRYENKNGIEDVKKAKWYLDRLISELEKKELCEASSATAPTILNTYIKGQVYRHINGEEFEILHVEDTNDTIKALSRKTDKPFSFRKGSPMDIYSTLIF